MKYLVTMFLLSVCQLGLAETPMLTADESIPIPKVAFDAKGDLVAGTAADTAAKLTAGADDTILMADSGQSTGLKWVAAGTPSTQAFGDSAVVGTADTFTRGDHKHAMPADPVTAHAAASDPHTGYVLESLLDAKGDLISASADNTPAILTVGTNGKVLSADSAETTGLKWVDVGDVPSGDIVQIGSGEGSIRVPGLKGLGNRTGVGSSAGSVSTEYSSGSSGLTWSPTSPTTEDIDSTYPDHLYLAWGATGSAESLGLKAFAPGAATAFDVRILVSSVVKASDGNSAGIGLIVTSSGDTSRLLVQVNPQARAGATVTAFTYAAGAYTQRGSTHTEIGFSPAYLRLSRDGSNNCQMWWSPNGRMWVSISTLSFTFTPASIGYRLSESGTTTLQAAVDFLRSDV